MKLLNNPVCVCVFEPNEKHLNIGNQSETEKPTIVTTTAANQEPSSIIFSFFLSS